MIRRWLPQKGAKVWGIPERYGFAIVIVALGTYLSHRLLEARAGGARLVVDTE